MMPNSVVEAVATTIPEADPWVTRVPMKTVLWRSVTGMVWPGGGWGMQSMDFTTGAFSPVKEDSSISRSTDCKS